jgi:hypothetical protein
VPAEGEEDPDILPVRLCAFFISHCAPLANFPQM